MFSKKTPRMYCTYNIHINITKKCIITFKWSSVHIVDRQKYNSKQYCNIVGKIQHILFFSSLMYDNKDIDNFSTNRDVMIMLKKYT